jgi:hypothetical protein
MNQSAQTGSLTELPGLLTKTGLEKSSFDQRTAERSWEATKVAVHSVLIRLKIKNDCSDCGWLYLPLLRMVKSRFALLTVADLSIVRFSEAMVKLGQAMSTYAVFAKL